MSAPAISWLPGHGAKPGGWDPGAASPVGWTEADLVRDVVAAAWRDCERRHIPSEVVAAGSYVERGEDAVAGSGSRLVVQVHANAGGHGADHAIVFYYVANEEGRRVAEAIAHQLRGYVPWPVIVREADEGWRNARACLAAVGPTSVLVEVGFVDGTQGRVLLPALAVGIGKALARAF